MEYSVSYVDMYTNYQFTASNGWRILDGGVPNGDGTYSGVILVSTGIPAKLHYNYLTGTEFFANGAVEVHNLILEELNDTRKYSEESVSNISGSAGDTGLFYLRGLENENPDYGYNSEVYSYYWLASAYNSLGYNLRFVHANGDINRYYNTSNGVRPVVSLESKIYKDGDIWKIQ